MEDFFGFIIFALIFIVGPLIEQLRKKEQQRAQKTQPRVPPPPQQTQRLPSSRTEEVSSKPRDAAATMVPDDLWKILTGEMREPPAPAETPRPAAKSRPWDVVYIPPEETEDEEEQSLEDLLEARRTPREIVVQEEPKRPWREPVSLEVTQANIISLEQPLPSARARHTAFHKKIEQKPVTPLAVTPKILGSREDLRRGFIMQEILGKPRGLE